MDFRLSAEEENLREMVADFVRTELLPLEPEFAYAPDIFEGSRWKSRVKTSEDPEIKSYLGLMQELEDRWNRETNYNAIFISATEKVNISELRQVILDKVKALYAIRYPYKANFY